jgi:hypothetical protein
METEEIYDILTEQLVAAINGYDPDYKVKVRQTVEVINRELPQPKRRFSVAEVQRYVEFDCHKHVRLLCRRGFLEVVPGREEEEGARLQRHNWPPPAGFFEGDGSAIGLAYYLQKWFQYNLQDWIAKRSRELESKEGVYSLEGWNARETEFADKTASAGGVSDELFLDRLVSSEGNYRTTNGEILAVDLGMLNKPLDVSIGSRPIQVFTLACFADSVWVLYSFTAADFNGHLELVGPPWPPRVGSCWTWEAAEKKAFSRGRSCPSLRCCRQQQAQIGAFLTKPYQYKC